MDIFKELLFLPATAGSIAYIISRYMGYNGKIKLLKYEIDQSLLFGGTVASSALIAETTYKYRKKRNEKLSELEHLLLAPAITGLGTFLVGYIISSKKLTPVNLIFGASSYVGADYLKKMLF